VWEGVPALTAAPFDWLISLAAKLEVDAKEFDQAAQPEGRAKLESELQELRTRKILSENRDTVLAHIRKMDKIFRLKQCIDATNTKAITMKGNDLMEKAVTETLQRTMKEELEAIGAERIPLCLKRRGSIGSTLHQLELDGAICGKVDLSGVLSEGEQCAVAIASFLAELGTSGLRGPIIFDDPVCSLDHWWREAVAERLAKEGLQRQIIVFTHDIVFVLALQDEASRQSVPLLMQMVRRATEGAGLCDTELPWLAMNVGARITHLKNVLQEARCKSNNSSQYQEVVERFYRLLRSAWERAVEEVVFSDVIQRYRHSIQTQRLRYVVLDDEDYIQIHRAMKKCSVPLHDQGAARNMRPSLPAELEGDLDGLDSFVKEMREKQKTIQKARSILEKPPQPEVG
jgi:energy-coupling factor transporter ATP-binding protein EcfA2